MAGVNRRPIVRAVALALLGAACFSPAAHANPIELFGGSSSSIARAGVVTASADGADAAFYNPAAFGRHKRREVHLGYSRLADTLTIETPGGRISRPMSDPDVILFGVTAPIGDYITAGITTAILPNTLLHVITRRPEEAFFPYFENRSQRLTLMPSVAVHPADWISFGATLDIFAGLGGTSGAREGPSRAAEGFIAQEIGAEATFGVGVLLQPIRQLRIGLTYRHGFSVPYRIPAITSSVGGISLTVGVNANGLATPNTLSLGAALTLGDLEIAADVSWRNWSNVPSPFVGVVADVGGLRLSPELPRGQYTDTFRAGASGAYRVHLSSDLDFDVRAGAYVEPSMVNDQPGRTNLIDGFKLGAAAGCGIGVPGQYRVDAHFATLSTFDRFHSKTLTSVADIAQNPNGIADEDASMPGDQITNPGYPAVRGSGIAMAFGLTLTVELDDPPPPSSAAAAPRARESARTP